MKHPLQNGTLMPDDAGTEKLVKRPSGKSAAVTMRDVANTSGFSPATVSIVLNNAPLARYIAPATKKKIEEAARKLGYRPNAMARFLRSKRTHSVGVMFFDITDPFCTPIPCFRARTCQYSPTRTTSGTASSAIWSCCWNATWKR
jgi:hypothetical protein